MRTLLTAVLVLALAPISASATLPGKPGKLAFGRDGHFFVVNADGTGLHQLSDEGYENKVKTTVAVAPGGKRVAYSVATPQQEWIVVADAATGTIQASTLPFQATPDDPASPSRFASITSPQWSANGKKLLAHCSIRQSDIRSELCSWTGRAGARPKQLTKCGCWGTTQPLKIAVAAGGHNLTYAESNGITYMDLRARRQRLLFTEKDDLAKTDSPSFSPDGKKIIFHVEGFGFDRFWTDIVTVANHHIRRLKVRGIPADAVYLPVWSPDGRRIAFVLKWRGTPGPQPPGIYTVAADGTGLKPIVTGIDRVAPLDWAPR